MPSQKPFLLISFLALAFWVSRPGITHAQSNPSPPVPTFLLGHEELKEIAYEITAIGAAVKGIKTIGKVKLATVVLAGQLIIATGDVSIDAVNEHSERIEAWVVQATRDQNSLEELKKNKKILKGHPVYEKIRAESEKAISKYSYSSEWDFLSTSLEKEGARSAFIYAAQSWIGEKLGIRAAKKYGIGPKIKKITWKKINKSRSTITTKIFTKRIKITKGKFKKISKIFCEKIDEMVANAEADIAEVFIDQARYRMFKAPDKAPYLEKAPIVRPHYEKTSVTGTHYERAPLSNPNSAKGELKEIKPAPRPKRYCIRGNVVRIYDGYSNYINESFDSKEACESKRSKAISRGVSVPECQVCE
jgi:hypothetical protein